MEQRQDPAAQLLYQLAVNARLRNALRQCISQIDKYGGGNGDVILKNMKQILEKVLYET